MGVCRSCGTSNPAAAKFCLECGTALVVSVPAQEQRKTVTVLFTDVTGSTQLGERLDPESLRRVLARFFDEAKAVIERHGGTVEKFIGDAVMAVFGVPVLHEDDAMRAVRAAAELGRALITLNEELQRGFGITLQTRTGINTGEVVTGTTERLATGDAVNVAARLQQLANPGEVLLGASTLRLVRDAVVVEDQPPADVKGKSEPIPVHRLVDVLTSAPRRTETALVGRSGQLQTLQGVFANVVRDRSCNLFTLLGPAGVGKSRLVTEFLAHVDATVVHGRCLSYGEGITYWPVVEVVKQLQAGSAAAEIESLLLENKAVANGIDVLLGAEGASSSAEIAWSVRLVLERAAGIHPLVVLLDDLHWAEATLFDLVEHVIDLSRDAPILLLVVARPELLERRPGWGGGKLNATTLLLEPLAGDETDELIDRLAPLLPVDVRAKVREAAGGNPLFVEEMVALVEAAGDDQVTVPPTIHALLAARLDQLEPSERRVLETGSVEGKTFHRGAVTALAPDEPEVPTRLIGLVRKDLLRPDQPELPGEEAFRFRHLLIRDAAYDGLAKSTRAELHEQFADWLDEHGRDLVERDEIVGYHLEQAYRYRSELGALDTTAHDLAARAAARLEAAGRRALVRGDTVAALNLLERAHHLLPPDQLDVSLELAIAEGLWACGRPEEAVTRAASAADKAAAAGDEIGAIRANLQRLVNNLNISSSTSWKEIQAYIDKVRPVLESSNDDAALAALWRATMELEHFRCRFHAALEAAKKWREHGLRSGDLNVNHSWISIAAEMVLGPTPIPEALAEIESAKLENPLVALPLTDWQAHLLAFAGEIDRAREINAESQAGFRERGLKMIAAMTAQGTWWIERAAGDHVAGERIARRGCEELDAMGERALQSTQLCQLAQSAYSLGQFDEAARAAARGLELADADDVITQMLARQVLAKVAAQRGGNDEARKLIDEALALSAGMQSPAQQADLYVDFAEVLVLAGDLTGAATELQRAVGLYEAKGATAFVEQTHRRLEELRELERAELG